MLVQRLGPQAVFVLTYLTTFLLESMIRTSSGHLTAAQRSTVGPRESLVQHFWLGLRCRFEGLGYRFDSFGYRSEWEFLEQRVSGLRPRIEVRFQGFEVC